MLLSVCFHSLVFGVAAMLAASRPAPDPNDVRDPVSLYLLGPFDRNRNDTVHDTEHEIDGDNEPRSSRATADIHETMPTPLPTNDELEATFPDADDDVDNAPADRLSDAERARIERQRSRLQRSDLEFATARAMQAARESLSRREHTFSIYDLDPEPELEEPGADLNIFERPSNGRAGQTIRTAFATERWISDYCVQTVSTPIVAFPAGEAIYALPMTNCYGPKPRDDLFEHLKRDR